MYTTTMGKMVEKDSFQFYVYNGDRFSRRGPLLNYHRRYIRTPVRFSSYELDDGPRD